MGEIRGMTMTLITFWFVVISISYLPYQSLGASLNSSNDILPSHYHLQRQSCNTSDDCKNPNKECISTNGLCFCKPDYDDVLTDSGGHDDSCMRSYGSSCSSKMNMHCNVYKNLACEKFKNNYDGVCVCHKHDDDLNKTGSPLVYDEKLKKCVALPGEKCDLFEYAGIMIGCVANAKCALDPNRTVDKDYYGICECHQGYVINISGTKCIPGIGSKCEVNADCEDDVGFECVDGKCSCAMNRIFDEESGKCRIKFGFDCESERDNCVIGTKCLLRIGKDSKGHGDFKWDYECACEAGKVFDEERGRCSVNVGGECGKDGVNICVIHAFCGVGNKCQCFNDYNVTENGNCQRIENDAIAEIMNKNHQISDSGVLRRVSGSSKLQQHYIVYFSSIIFSIMMVMVASTGFYRYIRSKSSSNLYSNGIIVN